MRDLDPKDIETLVALRGIVIRCSSIMPDMRQAVFRCTNRRQDDPSVSEALELEKRLETEATEVHAIEPTNTLVHS